MTARSARLASGLVGLACSSVLALAAVLQPSPQGHGTHVQIGLFPCTFLQVTGWPCPMCGATTTFALLAHGRVFAGIQNQPFAAMLFVATIAGALLGWVEAVAPRGRWGRIADALIDREAWIAGLLTVALALSWAWKIAHLGGPAIASP